MMHQGTNLEIEVKFLVADLAAVRERLVQAGGQLHKERVYERNIRFDTPWDALRLQGKLLRLRQDTVARITYKGESDQANELASASEARVREELEIVVEDFETAAAILARVGFEPREVYEKYRETFVLDNVEVVLDQLPFGDFVELEGADEDLQPAAKKLGLAWDKRILANYLALLAQLKDHHQLPFTDLTFTNFAGQTATLADLVAYADR